MHRLLLVSTFLLFLFSSLSAQVHINEAVTSNAVFTDEDGDTPDWLELYNPDGELNLSGWTLSDKLNNPGKWIIPEVTIPADGYLLFWASNKDRGGVGAYRTLVKEGDACRYLRPTGPTTNNWILAAYNDSSWSQGTTGIGYADGDDETTVPFGTGAVFVRQTFTVTNVDDVEELILDMDYDDGFVAYLNGVEIGRANLDAARPAWNAFTNRDEEARLYLGNDLARYVINDPGMLLEGENLLSIQVHNVSNNSSDMSLIPFLTARYAAPSQDGVPSLEILGLRSSALHTNFKLSSAGETVYLHDANGVFVDSLPAYGVPNGVSVGRPGDDGGAAPRLFTPPTPGGANPADGALGAVTDRVTFSRPGGLTNSFALTLSGAPAGTSIRYTLNNTEPTSSSPAYTSPLAINGVTNVRARIFRGGYIPSPTQTESYLIGVNHSLPVVSLVTNPDNFFLPETGIYVLGPGDFPNIPYFGSNIWDDVEVPINFSIFEPGSTQGYSFDGGTKIFGGWSRSNPQRSLSIFARGRYGTDEMEYPFFDSRPYDKFQALVLRNSGNEFGKTQLRDGSLTGLWLDSNVDIQAYQPAVIYLNGEYWGIQNIREKINEHYLASLHDVDPDEIDLLEFDASVIQGDNDEYLALRDYLNNNNLFSDASYNVIAEQIDLDNYIQYSVAQIYADNQDWPGNNIKYWKSEGGKWRWILFDTDFGAATWNPNAALNNTLSFALNSTNLNWPNPTWATLLFRRMTQNTGFRNKFVNQLADEMNSRLIPTAVISRINANVGSIGSEISAHNARWNHGSNWSAEVEQMRQFFRQRPLQMKNHVLQQWNLPDYHSVTIRLTDEAEGYVELNSLTIERDNWRGDYFKNVPIRLKAVAREGYVFSHWTLSSSSTDEEIVVNIDNFKSFRPVFMDEVVSTNAPSGGTLALVRNISLTPNPGAGQVNLAFTTSLRTRVRAQIMDITGRVLHTFTDEILAPGNHQFTANLSRLPAGNYLLNMTDGRGEASQKWIKQ